MRTGGNGPASRPPSSSRSRLPHALWTRRRAAEHGHGAFERCALRRDGARVVARIGLLLVRRVVLLVDADDAEPCNGREHRRPRADHDSRLASSDPRTLVAPLRLRQRRVEHRDLLAEARAEAAERLRCQRDLGDEHDRPAPTLRAPPRTPGGTPPSCRFRSRRRGGSWRSRRASSALDDPREHLRSAMCSAPPAPASPGNASRSAGCARSPRGFRCTGATSCERTARASTRSSRRPRARARRAAAAAPRRRARSPPS